MGHIQTSLKNHSKAKNAYFDCICLLSTLAINNETREEMSILAREGYAKNIKICIKNGQHKFFDYNLVKYIFEALGYLILTPIIIVVVTNFLGSNSFSPIALLAFGLLGMIISNEKDLKIKEEYLAIGNDKYLFGISFYL